ncbi:MAG: glycine hydroxymethyltransferase, partial [Luteolibacter sp.]
SGRDDITVGSAGVAAGRGMSASAETLKALRNREAVLDDFQSRPVTAELLAKATHVFAMTEGHLAALEAHFPQHSDKFYLLGEFAGVADVPDPIGLGSAAYEQVAEVMEKALPAILGYIDSTS